MSLDIGRYCSYSPDRGEERDRIYQEIEQRWGSQLERLTREDKFQALTYIAFTLAYSSHPHGTGDLDYIVEELQVFSLNNEARYFLQLVAKLPQSEFESLCEALVSQLKYGRHRQ